MSRLTPTALLVLVQTIPATAGPPEPPARASAPATESVQSAEADFLFGRPTIALGIRALWSRPRGDSDIFTFVTEELTLSKSDFNAPGVAVDVGFPLTSRLDVLAGVEFDQAKTDSEARHFVEDDGLPIQQETTLRQVNLSGSLDFALTPRGRSIGRYAWVTARVTPYVGVGGGLLWYQFEQIGDFVDSLDPDLAIVSARLVSDGWTVSSHVLVGVDIKLTHRLSLTTDVRYRWANATLSQDFIGFDPIDLTGLRIGSGVQFVF